MAVDSTAMKNALADAYKAVALYLAVYTAMGSAGSAGTEPSGGSPAYARKLITWGSSSGGVVTATGVAVDIPASTTVLGAGLHSAVTAGTYYDKATMTSQAFSSQGVYTITPTYTQT